MARNNILIEGCTVDELIAIDELEALVVTGDPIIFCVGSAEVLGEFSRAGDVLTVELAVVEAGGEGILITLVDAVERWSRSRVAAIEWIVYATDCAEPNPRLIRVLTRFGFELHSRDKAADCYRRRVSVNDSILRRIREGRPIGTARKHARLAP